MSSRVWLNLLLNFLFCTCSETGTFQMASVLQQKSLEVILGFWILSRYVGFKLGLCLKASWKVILCASPYCLMRSHLNCSPSNVKVLSLLHRWTFRFCSVQNKLLWHYQRLGHLYPKINRSSTEKQWVEKCHVCNANVQHMRTKNIM